jgi:hypothetical protein
MPKFGKFSYDNLLQCHPDLQRLFNEVIKVFDCTITCGHRGQKEQDEAFARDKSKVKWPNSKHNSFPSRAADVYPSPINYGNFKRMYYFAGYVKGTAERLGIKIRWGGDWDSDTEILDQKWDDLPHFELAQ